MKHKLLGILKHPGYNGKDSAPPPPDYTGAANATAAGNLEAARATSAANKVNQVTPYGNLTYSINGKDSYGNDLYTATQSLTPAQQAILDKTSKLNAGLMDTANTGLGYAQSVLNKPGVDTFQLPQVGINPGEAYQDAIMRRLQPQIERESQQSDAQLANQGIGQGTEAYKNAKTLLAQNQNDRLTSAVTGGFNTGLAANQNAFQQGAYNQMQPINVINALRTGSQVQNPNFVNAPQQANTQGPDILGATNQQYNAQLGATNASNAASGNFMGGLMGLGGAIFSDIRLKDNIEKLGTIGKGLNFYSFTYKDGFDLPQGKQYGVMAQEVEKVMPEAVIEMPNGYKAVRYDMLGV